MPPLDGAVSFLKRVAEAGVQESPAVGLGTTLRLRTPGIVGIGLRAEEALIHLAAFVSGHPILSHPGSPNLSQRGHPY